MRIVFLFYITLQQFTSVCKCIRQVFIAHEIVNVRKQALLIRTAVADFFPVAKEYPSGGILQHSVASADLFKAAIGNHAVLAQRFRREKEDICVNFTESALGSAANEASSVSLAKHTARGNDFGSGIGK